MLSICLMLLNRAEHIAVMQPEQKQQRVGYSREGHVIWKS